MNHQYLPNIQSAIHEHVLRIYPRLDCLDISSRLMSVMGVEPDQQSIGQPYNKWTEKDCWVITYGDSIVQKGIAPLKTLHHFASEQLKGTINGIHILPFFPYSSDDGFSVINYSQVNENLGNWTDIKTIASDFNLMADLVINHCSSRSMWFENYKLGKNPGKDFFVEASDEDDLSNVVRPRTSELLREVRTVNGDRKVWCTFSHDQVDLNFHNPNVLIEMVSIIRDYLDQGVRIFRLDAVAFLWKEVGTDCLHLPQTHEIIRLIRVLIEAYNPEAIIITETNVPNHENLSYFNTADEAHAVYNFSLPPLLLHALVSGTSEHLKHWQMSMPPAQTGTFYFNFIASHDGIGLRPVSGLLQVNEIDKLVETMESFGGRISWRTAENQSRKPYEINIALFDALQGTHDGTDEYQIQRFICAHAIMISLEGVPGIYIHSLLGTKNDYERREITGQNRSINRHRWDYPVLQQALSDDNLHHSKVFNQLSQLIKLRTQQTAFHPNAVQFTLNLGNDVFAFWRQSHARDQSIFCIHNVTNKTVNIPLSSVNLISLETWTDIISGQEYNDLHDDLKLAPYEFVWLTNRV